MVAAAVVWPADAVVLEADLTQALISLSPEDKREARIPLPGFSLDGSDDTVAISFADHKHLDIVIPTTGSGINLRVTLSGRTDGPIDEVLHFGGSFMFTDEAGETLPGLEGGFNFRDGSLPRPDTPLEVFFGGGGSLLTASFGDAYRLHGLTFTGSQNFSAAQITEPVLYFSASTSTSAGRGGPVTYFPADISVGDWVPEPASALLLGTGGLALLRRRA